VTQRALTASSGAGILAGVKPSLAVSCGTQWPSSRSKAVPAARRASPRALRAGWACAPCRSARRADLPRRGWQRTVPTLPTSRARGSGQLQTRGVRAGWACAPCRSARRADLPRRGWQRTLPTLPTSRARGSGQLLCPGISGAPARLSASSERRLCRPETRGEPPWNLQQSVASPRVTCGSHCAPLRAACEALRGLGFPRIARKKAATRVRAHKRNRNGNCRGQFP
jgi:hypothetical protein